jgi:hypothetical protein
LDKDLLIQLGMKKRNGEIKDSWNDIGSKFNITGEQARDIVRRYIKKNNINDIVINNNKQDNVDKDIHKDYKETIELNKDGSQTSDKLIKMSEEQCKDVEFLLKAHGYSIKAWGLVSARNNIWNVYSKQDGIQVLYSSKIVVKPKKEYTWNEEDIQKLFDSLKTNYKNKLNISPTQYEKNGNLLVVPIADLHYNLLSDKFSTGNDYNLEIAERIYYHAINDVINRVNNKKFEKVLFIVGNDFINADNLSGTTQKGTPQDNATSWFEAVEKAPQLIINGIDMLTKIAPVDVVYVPSNHDLHTMFGIMQTVKAWYRNDENINVDGSPLPRKYYKFGKTLFALSHDMKIKDGLRIITSEAKDKWSDSEHIICLLAHLHQAMIYEKQGYLEIWRLPTISGWSRWTNQQGYVQSEKKNQCFIVNSELGITDILNTIIK